MPYLCYGSLIKKSRKKTVRNGLMRSVDVGMDTMYQSLNGTTILKHVHAPDNRLQSILDGFKLILTVNPVLELLVDVLLLIKLNTVTDRCTPGKTQ